MAIDLSVTLKKLEVAVKRHPLDTPVRTSFGVMTSRPAVFVRVTDASGIVGYGEIWCNFPACGAEHRAALFATEVAPRVKDISFASPKVALDHANAALHILKLQTGEVGPICQAIAALDIAIWDVVARRAGVPVYEAMGGQDAEVQVYGSGINPDDVTDTVARLQREEYTRFKLKVGFGLDRDMENVARLTEQLRPNDSFMLDANQAWDFGTAVDALSRIEPFAPFWIEEVLAADTPAETWMALKSRTEIKFAGGENYDTRAAYDAACDAGFLDIIQPDVCKWGGLTGGLEVADYSASKQTLMCPHSLGAGVALAASAHLLAASGQPGFLEVDGNPNPLREDIFPITPAAGSVTLSDLPGLGVRTDLIDSFFE